MTMSRSRCRLALAVLCLALPFAGNAAEAMVHLRIRNSGEVAFLHVWQGWPERGTDHDFGRVEPGRTSHWHAFPAQLPHYRKTRLQPEHGRQIIDVIDRELPRGQARLAPGRYTLDYALRGANLQLHLIDESAVLPVD